MMRRFGKPLRPEECCPHMVDITNAYACSAAVLGGIALPSHCAGRRELCDWPDARKRKEAEARAS